MSISLKEAVKILDEGQNLSSLSNDPRLGEYVMEAARIGRDILTKLSDDEQLAAVTLVQSSVIADQLSDGNISSVMFLMGNMEESGAMFAIALRIAVGMATMEEWH